MNENLEQQFDEIISYLSEYWRLRRKIERRSLSRIVYKPFEVTSIVSKHASDIWKPKQDVLSGRTSERVKELIQVLAREDEKHTEFYGVLISNYSMDELSRNMEKRFGDVDFGKIKKLHELKRSKFLNFNFWQSVGFALGVASLILKTIPEQVVTKYINPVYEQFEERVFWVSMFATAYLLIVLSVYWWSYSKDKRKHDFITEVLEYSSLKQSRN